MHLPTSKLGSVIKAGSCFNSTIVPAASSVLQSPSSYSFQLQKKKKKKKKKNSAASLFRLRLGAPRTRFGAVKPPPSLRSSTPARVTVSRKKKLSLQETLNLLQNLPFESNDTLTDDSSDEEVPAN
ncbi:hypothetical protein TNCV_2662201 [Trichonephila clavipes]|nr:hypothetical protein TNCV_2662201 [Trichonephila clavipes]